MIYNSNAVGFQADNVAGGADFKRGALNIDAAARVDARSQSQLVDTLPGVPGYEPEK